MSQRKYIERVLEIFNMKHVWPVSTPFVVHIMLIKNMSTKTREERVKMDNVPYSSVIGSLIYAMVCTRYDIAYVVSVVSRFLDNLRKDHWEAVKWILRYLSQGLDECFYLEHQIQS